MTSPNDAYRPAAEILSALAHPGRFAIVVRLGEQPQCVHELVEFLGISQSLVSQHLRRLRSARIITGTRRGKEVLYDLTDRHILEIAEALIAHTEEK